MYTHHSVSAGQSFGRREADIANGKVVVWGRVEAAESHPLLYSGPRLPECQFRLVGQSQGVCLCSYSWIYVCRYRELGGSQNLTLSVHGVLNRPGFSSPEKYVERRTRKSSINTMTILRRYSAYRFENKAIDRPMDRAGTHPNHSQIPYPRHPPHCPYLRRLCLRRLPPRG